MSSMAVKKTMMIFDITRDDGWGLLLLLVVVGERKHAVAVGIIGMQLSALVTMTFVGRYWLDVSFVV